MARELAQKLFCCPSDKMTLKHRKKPALGPEDCALLTELKQCSSTRNLKRGKENHAEARKHGNDSNIYVATALINMYAKCDRLSDARQVFDGIKNPDVVSWNALMLGYAECGYSATALDLFTRMKSQDCLPTSITYVAALKACTSLALKEEGRSKVKFLEHGKQIHSAIGCHSNIYVNNTLINMYTKCGSMLDARCVFDSIKNPDVVSWTALILGYADNGEGIIALDFFAGMKAQGFAPDSFVFVAALKACICLALKTDESGRAECLIRGTQIHEEIGYLSNIYVQNTMIDMYAKCGSMMKARHVFDNIKKPDVVSWTALVMGYAEKGEHDIVMSLFARMRYQGCAPTTFTCVAALKACTSFALNQNEKIRAECLQWGKQMYSCVITNIYVESTLMEMFIKCGSMVDARQVFDGIKDPDVVSWNTLISGYAENGKGVTALELFARMKSNGCPPTSRTYAAALKACTSLTKQGEGGKSECLDRGKQIHLEIGCHSDVYLRNTLIDMYANCGSMVDAQQVFDGIDQPDLVSWNALMLGYSENGEGVFALNLFIKMKSQGFAPDRITFVAALKACGLIGALETGSKVHSEMMNAGIELDLILVTCLVDFYAKCGSLVEAQEVFDAQPSTRDLITWNALMAGYSHLGDTKRVFGLFEGMRTSFRPDGVTFLCILTCCSHAGLLGEGRKYFSSMSTDYGITPLAEHYNCMVDILGRSNKLNDAINLLQNMPFRPDAVTWMTVLSACRQWNNVEIGRLAFSYLAISDDTAAVLMAQIYGTRSMWEEQDMVLRMRTEGLPSQREGTKKQTES